MLNTHLKTIITYLFIYIKQMIIYHVGIFMAITTSFNLLSPTSFKAAARKFNALPCR